jgi:hypothetical protein
MNAHRMSTRKSPIELLHFFTNGPKLEPHICIAGRCAYVSIQLNVAQDYANLGGLFLSLILVF